MTTPSGPASTTTFPPAPDTTLRPDPSGTSLRCEPDCPKASFGAQTASAPHTPPSTSLRLDKCFDTRPPHAHGLQYYRTPGRAGVGTIPYVLIGPIRTARYGTNDTSLRDWITQRPSRFTSTSS